MQHTSRGIALKIGATLAFGVQYVGIKLAGSVPVGEVVLFRAAFALVPAWGFVAGASLFAGDLALRQFAGHVLFPSAAPTGS